MALTMISNGRFFEPRTAQYLDAHHLLIEDGAVREVTDAPSPRALHVASYPSSGCRE
jgi:hypothetical protein